MKGYQTVVFGTFTNVICCAVVGVMMVFLLERYDFPGRRLLSILVLVPMALPPLVDKNPEQCIGLFKRKDANVDNNIRIYLLYSQTIILERYFE